MNIEELLIRYKIKNYTTYGTQIAKVDENSLGKNNGKLILVSSISPTKQGNGKTTVSIGLADAINKTSNCILCLREPSMGPVFGMKGGATGGGKSAIEPSDQINLHFTGDMHAITSANNLICACIDNSIYHGNLLNIDINSILINRCVDCNDRALRDIVIGDKDHKRKESFIITSATEIMAILCLSKSFIDLKNNISNMLIAKTLEGNPIYVKDLGITDAVCALLVNAVNPNAVSTSNKTLTFVHGGPFANIAHGASSIIATNMALSFADYVVTEAGFGADLGAEKFFNVVSPKLGKYPDCVVLVATVQALLYNGNGKITNGISNLERHIDNLKYKFKTNVVVAINKFSDDTKEQLKYILDYCKNKGIDACVCDCFNKGVMGAQELANYVINNCKNKNYACSLDLKKANILDKLNIIAKEIYGASRVVLSSKAKDKLEYIKKLGYEKLPVVVAKTQYSFSTDDSLLGAPINFEILVKDFQIKTGAGFVVAVCGKTILMPALPASPNACRVKLSGKKLIKL